MTTLVDELAARGIAIDGQTAAPREWGPMPLHDTVQSVVYNCGPDELFARFRGDAEEGT